ncbi:MAG: helix-turn-helix domain-containing protein [Firmicutes bacterium]|jgi:hypothetical protein|nr:helix-turn-helix domain-containing protein [Bacillota bacterium]
MELLGKRIRARRRQLRLTQRDIATAATSSFISRIERGHDLPSLEVLKAGPKTCSSRFLNFWGISSCWKQQSSRS